MGVEGAVVVVVAVVVVFLFVAVANVVAFAVAVVGMLGAVAFIEGLGAFSLEGVSIGRPVNALVGLPAVVVVFGVEFAVAVVDVLGVGVGVVVAARSVSVGWTLSPVSVML